MKKIVFMMCTAIAGIFTVQAKEYIWTGLGRAGDWNDPANWNTASGTPGSGDTVYMNRTVAVNGSTHNVALPIVVTSPFVLGEKGLTLKIGTGVTNYISGAISGPGELRVTGNNSADSKYFKLTAIQNGNNAWTSALVLSGDNSYLGGTSADNVFLRGDSVSAFGAEGSPVKFGGVASVSLNTPGKWRGYAYRVGVPTNVNYPLSLQFGESLEWNGTLSCDDASAAVKLYLLARQGVAVDAYANVNASGLNLYPAFHSTARVDFRNSVHVKAFCSDGGSVGTCGGLSRLHARGGTYESTQIGFVFNVCCMDDYVFDESRTLNFWSRYGNANTGWCDLNGRDQRAKGLVSSWDAGADYSETGNYLGSRNGLAATMHLVGARQDCLYRGLLTNEVSVVWMPDGDFVQTFSNRVHETTGRLVVSNGTMRIAGSATFKKVPEIVIASGASFECLTSASGALSGLRRLVIEDGAVFKVGEKTPLPFAAGKIELVVRGSGMIVLPEGMKAVMRTTVAGGMLPSVGIYTSEVSWIGGGEIDVGNAGVTCWKNAVSGRWGDAANWSAGVPVSSSVVFLAAEGGDYTVSIDAGADLGRELHVHGTRAAAATLAIGAAAVMTNGFVYVEGGRISVSESGMLFYEGKGNGERTASESTDVVVVKGGRIDVDGGSVEFSRMCGRMCVTSGDGLPGIVGVKGGSFRHLADTWGDYFRVEKGGSVEVSGGKMEFDVPSAVSTVGFRLFGGRLSVSGGAFGVGGKTEKADLRLHSGEALFSGTGVLQLNAAMETKCMFATSKDSDDLTVRFEGQARISPSDIKVFNAGGTSTGDVRVDWCTSAQSAESETAFRAMIGHGSGGSVVMNISGAAYRAGAEGVYIGFSRLGSWPQEIQRGEMNVGEDGLLTVEGFGAGVNGYSDSVLMGLMVGYSGLAASSQEEKPFAYPFDGELNIASGGMARVLYGDVGVGVGFATGRLTVDGGTLAVCSHEEASPRYDYRNRTFGVGLFGGVGICTLENGASFDCGTDVFIGGTVTNRYPCQGGGIEKKTRLSMDHSATGTLVVADAEVALDGDLVLGMDGFGTLRRTGSSGSFSASGLVCTNVADVACTGSRIEFVADADGVGALDLADGVVIGENAALRVDLSGYTGGRRSFRLVGCRFRIGDFSEMTVTGAGEDLLPARFEWTSRGLYLKTRRDMTVVVR